jgi:bifunctional non-homologous end joining protein LigD
MTEANRPTSVSLSYTEGSSDKVYNAQVEAKADGFVVNVQYGRRSTSLTAGCKTPQPVAFEVACKVFDKLVAEKKSKGYSEVETGVAFAGTDKAGRVSGVLPQLLNAICDDEAAALCLDEKWACQEKHDGNRTLVRVQGEITGINRKGLTVALPSPIVESLRALPGVTQAVFDGELIGNQLFIWDVLFHDGVDCQNLPLSARLLLLDNYSFGGAVKRSKTFRGADNKREAVERFRTTSREGAVFKRLDAPYTVGRPATGGTALKLKFVATATVKISRINTGKRSVGMELADATGQFIDVGNVTIPPNVATMPSVGELIEVQYLYAFPNGGSLFQPIYLRPRNADQDETDAVTAQLKYKTADADAARAA